MTPAMIDHDRRHIIPNIGFMLLSHREEPKDRTRFNKDFSLLQLYRGCLFYVGSGLLSYRDRGDGNNRPDFFIHQRCNKSIPYWLFIPALASPQIEALVSADPAGFNHGNTSD